MPTLHHDRRVNRTRRLLRDALMALILEKGYDAVTIEDITERADLGRTTFYLHYKEKEDLLLESIDTIAEDLKAQVALMMAASLGMQQPLSLSQPEESPIFLVFRHAEENANLYHIILQGEGGTRAASRLREIINDAALDYFKLGLESGALHLDPQAKIMVISNYFAASLLGFITWWLEKGRPFSALQMTQVFTQMFFFGLRGFISD